MTTSSGFPRLGRRFSEELISKTLPFEEPINTIKVDTNILKSKIKTVKLTLTFISHLSQSFHWFKTILNI